MAQPLWSEINQAIADRIRETEDITGTIPVGEVDIPYYDKVLIEQSLLEISQEILREIPTEGLEASPSAAVITVIALSSPQPTPLNLIRVASTTIQPTALSGKTGATQPVPPATFLMNQNVNPNYETLWSVFGGAVNFTGFSATIVEIVEPPLADWQAGPILPDGYTEEQIDRVMKQLQIMNFEPQGGI